MNRKYLTTSFVILLMFLGIVLTADDIFFVLEKATDINFSEKPEEENAARILKWNFKECPKIIYTGREYGEGTVTARCSNGKAYLLSFTDYHHATDSFDVYDWNIEEIDFNTLKYNLGNSFKEWCLQRTTLSAEARKTVEVLLKEAGTSDCELAAKDLSSRTVLSLPEAPITDLRPLAGLTNLKELYLTLNEITDVAPLARLTNLEKLVLSQNPIADVTLLAGLTNLTELDLHGNDITDVSPLAGLINLKDLRLNNNEMTDVSPLARLTNLRLLNLTGNPLTEQTCPLSARQTVCDFEKEPGN